MKTYYYPENLRASVKLWFWNVRDFIIICAGIVLSVIVLVNLWNILPLAWTGSFAFLTIRTDDMAIIDYLINAFRFFVLADQRFECRAKGE